MVFCPARFSTLREEKEQKKGQIIHVFFFFIAHSFTSCASFYVAQVFIPSPPSSSSSSPSSSRQQHPKVMTGAGRTLNLLLFFSFFFFFCLQVLTPRFTTHFPGRVWLWRSCCLRKCLCALGIISALPAVAPDTLEPLSRPLTLEQLILTTHDV